MSGRIVKLFGGRGFTTAGAVPTGRAAGPIAPLPEPWSEEIPQRPQAEILARLAHPSTVGGTASPRAASPRDTSSGATGCSPPPSPPTAGSRSTFRMVPKPQLKPDRQYCSRAPQ